MTYGPRVVVALKVAAQATDWICSKCLAAALPKLVPALEREGALRLTLQTKEQLLAISGATIDRKLAAVKRREKPRGASTTQPGSLLKKQIPMRVYIPWDEQKPGFMEIDLVAHCGKSTAGEYINMLTAVDASTGCTEVEPALNKGQKSVFEALERIRVRLPFPLLGIDSDNGAESIDDHLFRYCERHKLTFTRCRPYHKNDQAHVEQKNYVVVRQLVGYNRYGGEAALEQLGRVYALSRVRYNGVLPMMKPGSKTREGARVTKEYDNRTTPFERAVAAKVVGDEAKAALQVLLQERGPMALKRRIDAEAERLWQLQAGARHTVSASS